MSDDEKYTPPGAETWHPDGNDESKLAELGKKMGYKPEIIAGAKRLKGQYGESLREIEERQIASTPETTEETAPAEKTVLETAQEYSADIKKTIRDDFRDNPERAEIIAEQAGKAFMIRCELAENLDGTKAIKNAFTLGLREATDAHGVEAGTKLANKLKESNWDTARIEDALEGMFLVDIYGHAPARAITTLEKMGEDREIPAKDMMIFHLPEINNAVKIAATSEGINAFGIKNGISKESYIGYLENALKGHGIAKKESPDGIPYFEEEKTEGGDGNV